MRAYKLMEKAFPKEVEASRLTFALEREDGPLTKADFVIVDQIIKEVEKLRDANPDLKLGKVSSYQDGILGQRMTSGDGQCTLIQVSLETPFLAIGTLTTVDRTDKRIREKLRQSWRASRTRPSSCMPPARRASAAT